MLSEQQQQCVNAKLKGGVESLASDLEEHPTALPKPCPHCGTLVEAIPGVQLNDLRNEGECVHLLLSAKCILQLADNLS